MPCQDLRNLVNVIHELDQNIEDYVYDVYGIPSEEREEINEYYNVFNNPSSLQLDI